MTAPPPFDVSFWGLPRPDVVRKATGGTNNEVWILDETYVLRIYHNLDAEQIAAEHRLVSALTDKGDLTFAVPVPIGTTSGATVVHTNQGKVSLFPRIDGEPGDRTDPIQAERAGEALARLDLALAELPPSLAPHDWRVPLDAIHPAVTDIDALTDELGRLLPGDEGVRWFREHCGPSERAYRGFLGTLPSQITHNDLAMSNVLFASGKVSAVLDFEVAGIDLRIADLVAALSMLEDETVRSAFRRGYEGVIALQPEELAAIPELLRYRALTSIIWRAGRWRRGQSTLGDVHARLRSAARES